jgi:hypothetical protein
VLVQVVPPLIEYSNTVPAPQPVALIEPEVTGEQVLFVIVNVGALGLVHVPGTVATELVGLVVNGEISQIQRVNTVTTAVWLYVGRVVFQVIPPSIEYCKVDPVGQVVEGTAITPPATVQLALQVLLVTTTEGAAAVKVGQVAQITGKVAPLAFVLTHDVAVLRHLANTLITEVV